VPRSGRWRTTFKHKSHRYCLGTFSTAEEAARVWDLAAIKSRAPDFGGLNFPRESYAYEMELLDKYSLEQTLHMLKVKLVNAKRSGRAVKRKLDSALEEEKAGAGRLGVDLSDMPIQPYHVLSRSPTRKGTISSSKPVRKHAGSNPFFKSNFAAKRTSPPQPTATKKDSLASSGSKQSGSMQSMSREFDASMSNERDRCFLASACDAMAIGDWQAVAPR
jgi:hypothetical protein